MKTIVYLLCIWVSCSFALNYTDVKCKKYPPPKNGIILCRRSRTTGDSCNVVCDDGYDVAFLQADQYICGLEGKWQVKPEIMKMPWPDCDPINPDMPVP